MKLKQVTEIDISPSDVKRFKEHLKHMSEDERKQFIVEFTEQEKVQNNALDLLDLVARHTALDFMWQTAHSNLLNGVWKKAKELLDQGYHIGLSEYAPYPPKIVDQFHAARHASCNKRELITTAFQHYRYKNFMTQCKNKSTEMFDEWK